MPNGGFGCAYCVYCVNSRKPAELPIPDRDPGWCVLREALLPDPYYSICENQDMDRSEGLDSTWIGNPKRNPPPPPELRPALTGSIFSITSSEGAYMDIPWLGAAALVEHRPGGVCDICGQAAGRTVRIMHSEVEHVFCSFRHYLEWRAPLVIGTTETQVDSSTIQRFRDPEELSVVRDRVTEGDIARNGRWFDASMRRQRRASGLKISILLIVCIVGVYLLIG